jgi:formate dehydrogenase (coenzyme F420) beta subunit
MTATQRKIQALAKAALEQGKVEMVIGYRRGTLPMMNEPALVRSPADVDTLVWDGHCGINLVNYLSNRKEKIGIIAKGCDSRNIVTHILENKIKREQLYIIGVPCTGMLNRHGITAIGRGEILTVSESDDTVTITDQEGERNFPRAELLQENCRTCLHRNPVLYDDPAGDLVTEQTDVDRYADIRHLEAMDQPEKKAFFDNLLAPCIRCYACRNACPLCYCPTCFVDESRPQWVGKGDNPTDIHTFHFLRAYHCAGRCTDCGACQRACPMNINVRLLTKKLEKDCLELFQWEAGLSLDQRPPLDTFKPDDPNDFIR